MKYKEPLCLQEVFERQVDKHPLSQAVVYQGRSFSYQEIDDRANRFAHFLVAQGVTKGDFVPIYLNRSDNAIITILAVLKAGAAYVPIDPSHPKDRISFILESVSAKLLVTELQYKQSAGAAFHGQVILLDEVEQPWTALPSTRPTRLETGVTPNDLCYILYTSGTTGHPKGIMTEHRNVFHFTEAFNDTCKVQHSDRIYQGFSLSFDGSVEEIWMAFTHGACLVIGTTDVARLGNETACLMNDEKVTVFSTVPTFLGMIEIEVPSLRLLIVSGEPCPPHLVNRWVHPGRRMLNVYGPTETTVNATVAECMPNRPVTIGHALRNYSIHILDENRTAVAPGEMGELYIGGAGVARGYFKQPELSKEKFISHFILDGQTIPRLYRTGDLVRTTPDGELEFYGRIDTQVKIRGYRVELSEIESVLREHESIQHAVVHIYKKRNMDELAACVVPRATLSSEEYSSIFEHLHKRLPAYMIPSYLDAIDTLPTLTSGKVDRKTLPEPKTPLVLKGRSFVAPKSETERKILDVWERVFDIQSISVRDDFFLDLGGYSLIAAEVVSTLRHDYGFLVSLRDVYDHPTIQQLAQHMEGQEAWTNSSTFEQSSTGRSASQEAFEGVSPLIRSSCMAMQALILILSYGSASLALGAVVYIIMLAIQGALPLAGIAIVLALLLFFGFPLWVLTTIAGKWLVIGRYKAGKYPLWSFYYLRWWIAMRMQAMSGMGLFTATPLLPLYMRLMGARVGSGCVFDTALSSTFDLLSIDDDTSIGSQTQISGYRIEDGMLLLAPIRIGKRCFIGTHSALGLDVSMGDDSMLGDLSFLEDHAHIPPQNAWRGSPARPGQVPVPELPHQEAASAPRPWIWGLLHYISLWALMFLTITIAVPPVGVVVAAWLIGGITWAFLSVFAAAPLMTISFCLFTALAKAILLPKPQVGVFPMASFIFLRKWLLDILMMISKGAVHNLYTTIYLPTWLRMMGAKIGRRAEISTVSQLAPELIDIGDESFFADGSIVGCRKFFRGHAEFARSFVGRRSFVGNNAMLTLGSNLNDNCLLGCLSVPPEHMESAPDGSEWLGSPSFRLPYRKKIESFPLHETFRPNLRLYMTRCFIDGMRILIPNLIGSFAFLTFISIAVLGFQRLPLGEYIALVLLLGLLITLTVAFSIIALKWLVMGQFKPVIKPLWSVYVWLNELINGAYETIAAPLLAPLLGTPFFAWYMRALGCKIGKHNYIGTTLFSEFDLVEIGDYAALNAGVVIQNHLFEDRVMKSSYLKIGDGCSIGNMSVILYDTEIQSDSSIAPLSLLMKGEVLAPRTKWVGIPTQQYQQHNAQGEKPFTPISSTSRRTATMN